MIRSKEGGEFCDSTLSHFALCSPVSSYYQEPLGALWLSKIMGNVFSDLSRACPHNVTRTRPRKGSILGRDWNRETCGPWAWEWLIVTPNICARSPCKPQRGWASFLPWEYRKSRNQEDSSVEAFYTFSGCEGRDSVLLTIIGTMVTYNLMDPSERKQNNRSPLKIP